MPRPTIVCLCGSTRFIDAFQKAEFDETLAGRIVLTIGCDTKSDEMLNLPPGAKEKLDALHLEKVALADEVLILNVGGYLGDSTRRELIHAMTLGKRVRFLEEPSDSSIVSLLAPGLITKVAAWMREAIKRGLTGPVEGVQE